MDEKGCLSILTLLLLSLAVMLTSCGGGGGIGKNDGDSGSGNCGSDLSPHWARSYGQSGHDEANSIQQTNDGGYIVAGWTNSFGAGYDDFWVLKLDSSGKVSWQKTYGGAGGERAFSIQQTDDGGYIVAGWTSSFGAGDSDFWIMKLDSNGNIIWQKTYGGIDIDEAFSIQQTNDGGYIVLGYTGSNRIDIGFDLWVIKLDSSGAITWQKIYGRAGSFDLAASIQQTNDGGYIIAGETYSFGTDSGDFWVLKLNSGGVISWQKTYGGIGWDYIYSILQTRDGGYVVAGGTNSFGGGKGKDDVWVIKLDSNGAITWQKTFGGTSIDVAYSIQQTCDGGYIVAGETLSFAYLDFWLIKLDESGKIMWQKTYGGNSGDKTSSVQQTNDGGYIVGGSTWSFGAGNSDFWVLRLKSDGRISPTAPVYIGADTSATVQATSVVPVDTFVTPLDSIATVIDTTVMGVDTNAIVETQASD